MYHAQSPPSHDVIELKGSALTVVVLHLKNSDPRMLYPRLEEVIDEAGAFLASAPVVIDIAALGEEAQEMLDFSYLLRFLRGANLMPVGVQGAAASQKNRIAQAGLLCVATAKKGNSISTQQVQHGQQAERAQSVLTDNEEALDTPLAPHKAARTPARTREPEGTPQAAAHAAAPQRQTAQRSQSTANRKPEPIVQEPVAPPPAASSALVITQHVRAGQQISAPDGDLIVLASVNAGSELFAAGNIHVYGTLRGRALAGVNGDTSARIFTLQGNPELLAIAGEYVVNEELPRRAVNQSFAVSWSESGLRFQIFGSFGL